MRLVTNSVAPNQVRETDDAWIIEDVPFVRPMELSGGYVPRKNIKQTANQWDSVPATLNHPRDKNGKPIAANMKPETHLGVTKNTSFDGEFVRGDIRINKDRIQEVGGEAHDVERALRNGEEIDVSTQYASEDLQPGTYDGEYRANVERIIRADGLAILPNTTGKCSVEDGCGINPQMVANSGLSIPMRANAKHFESGDLVEWQTGDATAQGRVLEVFDEPGSVTRTFDGTEVTREVAEDENAYLVEAWDEDDFNSDKQALKAGNNVSEWSSPPDEAMSANKMHMGEIPDEYKFDNPGEAMEKAQEMGLSAIHAHGEGEDTTFMPGENMKVLESTMTDDGENPEDMDMSANQFDMALTDIGSDDVDSYTDSEWDGSAATAAMPNPSKSDDAPDALDASHLIHPVESDMRDDKSNWKLPFREGADAPVNTRALVAARAAISGARGGVDAPEDDSAGAEERAVEFLVDAPSDMFGSMESADAEMNGASGHMEDNSDTIVKKVLQKLGFASGDPTANERAESRADTEDTDSTMNRQDLIDEITANSPLTENALRERCNDGLEAIHDDVMAANDDSTDDMTDNNDNVREITESELEELVANKAEEIISEREEQSRQEDLASEIVANSAEYEDTESVLDDFPTEAALKTKKEQVTPSAAAVPGRGASTTANADDADEFPDMTIGGDD